jgi:hypothetical protein
MEVRHISSPHDSFLSEQLTGPGCSSGLGVLFELGASIPLLDTVHPNNGETRTL